MRANSMEQACHYCTIYTLEEMIKNISQKENDYCLTFWASSIYAMNDPSEFVYGYNLLTKDILPSIEKELRIKDDRLKLSRLWRQIEGINAPKEWDEKLMGAIYECHQSPFIISFSRQKDFLPMWNTYSDKGRGVCLCFDDYGWICKNNDVQMLHKLHTSEVSYGKVDQSVYNVMQKLYANCYERYKDLSDGKQRANEMAKCLASIVVAASPYHKHKAYEYEKESRLIVFKKDEHEVKYRCTNHGRIVSYIEIPIKLEYLQRIIVGPCADSASIVRELKARLSSYGITDIVPSQIPYREY